MKTTTECTTTKTTTQKTTPSTITIINNNYGHPICYDRMGNEICGSRNRKNPDALDIRTCRALYNSWHWRPFAVDLKKRSIKDYAINSGLL
jgi:hypothetical protein